MLTIKWKEKRNLSDKLSHCSQSTWMGWLIPSFRNFPIHKHYFTLMLTTSWTTTTTTYLFTSNWNNYFSQFFFNLYTTNQRSFYLPINHIIFFLLLFKHTSVLKQHMKQLPINHTIFFLLFSNIQVSWNNTQSKTKAISYCTFSEVSSVQAEHKKPHSWSIHQDFGCMQLHHAIGEENVHRQEFTVVYSTKTMFHHSHSFLFHCALNPSKTNIPPAKQNFLFWDLAGSYSKKLTGWLRSCRNQKRLPCYERK